VQRFGLTGSQNSSTAASSGRCLQAFGLTLINQTMGLGRRRFLEYVSIALAGLTLDPLQSIVINSNNYVNRKFGFLLTKPMGWDFVSIKDFGKLKSDQSFSEEFEPNKDEVWEDLGDPILVIAKYGLDNPEHHDKFSPAITVFINHKSDIAKLYEDDYIQGDFEKIVGMVAYGSGRLFKDYETIRSITPYNLSDCLGFDSEWTWTFESSEHKKRYTCKTWSIMIEKGDYIYSFNMIDSEQAGEVEEKTFKRFVDSIKII